MKIAFLFSGQGAQYHGMGKDLYEHVEEARMVFDSLPLSFDVKSFCFDETSKLHETKYSQACIYAVSMAAAKALEARGIHAQGCAGLSLGEYAAYCYANAISLEDGAKLLEARGRLMQEALPKDQSGMAAVLFLEEEQVKEALKDIDGVCEIANINCPGQIVISGEQQALEEGIKKCLAQGARKVIPLNVSGAFHSSLLKEASKTLHEILSSYTWNTPNIPIYNNISGEQESIHPVEILTKQLYSTVYFEKTLQNMVNDGFDTFIEVGPGTVLSGFVKKTLRKQNIEIYHVEDVQTLEECIRACKERES